MRFSKRKIYFIKKDFQSRFILRFVAIATICAVASVFLFVYLAKKRLDSIRYSSYVDIKTTGDLLLPITIIAHVISLIIFAGILAYTIYSLWKRISSPLQKIKMGIAKIAVGDLKSYVTLDSDEEFQDLAADLEGMRSALRARFIRIKEQQQGLTLAAAELDRSIREGISPVFPAASLRDAVERMKADVEAIHY